MEPSNYHHISAKNHNISALTARPNITFTDSAKQSFDPVEIPKLGKQPLDVLGKRIVRIFENLAEIVVLLRRR